MQLLEVKNDTAKISYNPADNYLLPADFLLVEDDNQKILAQVTGFETSQNKESVAVSRLALSIDKNDNISYYNGYIPSSVSKVMYVNAEEIAELIEGTGEKIFIGSIVNKKDCFVKPDISFLDDKLYIRSDNDETTKEITQNLLYQINSKNKRAILFDFDGTYSELEKVKRLKVSDNFKLPLNINAFDTILEYDTKECPVADKAVIQSIVLELREYLKTLDDGYLAFTAFKNVIDSEFEENQIPGLMLLKNKLYLYSQDNVFADKKEEFDVTEDAFFNNNIVVVDASAIEEKWFKFVVQSVIERLTMKTYIFLPLNEVQVDKKFLTAIYKNNCYVPVISTSYNSKYSSYLTQIAKNMILCKPQSPLTDNYPYSSLLNKINDEEFIIYGNATYRLPVVLNHKAFGEEISEEIVQNEIKKDVDKFFVPSKGVLPSDKMLVADSDEKTPVKKSDNDFTDDDLDFLDESKTPATASDKKDDWNDDWNDEWKDEWQDVPGSESTSSFELMPVDREEDSENSDSIDDLFFDDDDEENDIENSAETSDIKDIHDDNSDSSDIDAIFEEENDSESGDSEFINDESTDNSDDDIMDNLMTVDELSGEKKEEENVDENVDDNVPEFVEEDDDCVIIPDAEDIVIHESEDEEEELLDEEPPESNLVFSDSDDENTVLSNVINNIEEKAENDSSTEPESGELVFSDDDDNEVNENSSSVNSDSDDGDIIIPDYVEEPEDEILPPEINEDISDFEAPDVQVYETDVPVSDVDETCEFKMGDRVYHPKHGYGVIEGFANYSNKIMFCQIEFENVGRRILDPKVSNLQKVN